MVIYLQKPEGIIKEKGKFQNHIQDFFWAVISVHLCLKKCQTHLYSTSRMFCQLINWTWTKQFNHVCGNGKGQSFRYQGVHLKYIYLDAEAIQSSNKNYNIWKPIHKPNSSHAKKINSGLRAHVHSDGSCNFISLVSLQCKHWVMI